MGKKKQTLSKKIEAKVSKNKLWEIHRGELKRGKGRPPKTSHLFRVIGEKLPVYFLDTIERDLQRQGHGLDGIYIAHDSMGCARYIGRGNIFNRLRARIKAQKLEIKYYSFYVVSEKKHEREIETLLIRAAGFLLEFNTRKKRLGISSGNIKDYEAGTYFYERQYKRGRRKHKTEKKKRRHK
ncbi:MAG: hypothetical protein GC131_03800 [Alphaproteobacteria bacterium]|nr:hypothetical protein [Alphaproteobacteria bacterium]